MKNNTTKKVSKETKARNNFKKKIKRKIRKEMGASNSHDDEVAYLCARYQPFHPRAVGAKAPDNFKYPSSVFSVKSGLTAVTDANGNFAIAFFPWADQFAWQPASISGAGVVTWNGGTATATANFATLQSMAALIRTIGYGVRMTCEAPITTASGHVYTVSVPINSYLQAVNGWYEFPSTEPQIVDLPLTVKMPTTQLCTKSFDICGRAFDEGIFRFRDPLSPNSDASQIESSMGWAAIIVYGRGLPAASYVNFDHVLHLEYIANPANSIPLGVSTYGRSNMIELQNASNLQDRIPLMIEDEKEINNVFGRIIKVATASAQYIPQALDAYDNFRNILDRNRISRGGGGTNYVKYLEDLD